MRCCVSDRADFFVSGRTTSTDADIDHQTEYLIYVRKEDYDRAMFLVQRNLKGISGNEKKIRKNF